MNTEKTKAEKEFEKQLGTMKLAINSLVHRNDVLVRRCKLQDEQIRSLTLKVEQLLRRK